VHIIDTMPVTGVGKIFKPALRWRMIEQVFTERLQGATDGVDVAVNVGERPGAGVVASVSVASVPADRRSTLGDRIAAVLGKFAVRHEIVWR
jgi:fatty-acyl-CoA synthase